MFLEIECTMNKKRLRSKFAGNKYHPAYALVIDHKNKAIVLAIRGSINISDIIIDSVFETQEFSYINEDGIKKTGFAHKGWYLSAKNLRDRIQKSFEMLIKKYNYRPVFTGHSLGAATASILGIMLHHNFPELKVFAYGSCPIVDIDTAHDCHDFITTIIQKDDIAPRVSKQNIIKLIKSLKNLKTHMNEQKPIVYEEIMKESSDASIPSLFVAGKCIWKNCKSEEWKMVDNTAFNEIHLDCNIPSHLTDGYYVALKAKF